MSDIATGVLLHHGDIAPGDEPAGGTEIVEGIRGYLIGLGLAVLAVWIMTHLNYNMIPMERLMQMQR